MSDKVKKITRQLISAGKTLHKLGMVPATSGNFSARIDARKIAITVSGAHKGHLTEDDILCMDLDGKIYGDQQPSAETELHLQLYRHLPRVHCVLHPHSRSATLTRKLDSDRIELEGYELQKAFEGIKTHLSTLIIPIFNNDQDIPRLALEVETYLQIHPDMKAYIIRGHGFYTWASSIAAALRHCEALEFLLGCELDHPITS